MSHKFIRRTIRIVIVAIVAFVAWQGWKLAQPPGLPKGIVFGNGRIESIQVDVATKYGGRVKEILAQEGDLVEPGQVLARMDTIELEAQIAGAQAKQAESEETVAEVRADIIQRESELKFAQQKLARSQNLFQRKVISQEEFDQTESQRNVARAAVDSAKAKLRSATKSIDAAIAEVKRIQAQIDDSVLKSPVKGRVLYRLAELDEVLGAGGKVLTLVNLSDVYMEIYLPSKDAALVAIGADARIVLDAIPEYAARAKVSFVAPEAQFTPKQVETRSEREKLMFRVKLRLPPETILPYIERIKTGVRGLGYIRLDNAVAWPDFLERRFPKPPSPQEKSTGDHVDAQPAQKSP